MNCDNIAQCFSLGLVRLLVFEAVVTPPFFYTLIMVISNSKILESMGWMLRELYLWRDLQNSFSTFLYKQLI